MKRALVSYATGEHRELLEIARPSFEQFADRHGYDVLIPEDMNCGRAVSWWKVPILKEALIEYGEVLWLDADTVIVDGSDDIVLPEDKWQGLVEHHTADGHVPNCGVWKVRRPMVAILETLWYSNLYVDHGWWEQAALLTLMGYRVQAPARVLETTELLARTEFLDPGWNRHIWDQQECERVRIQHATMHPDRAAVMREWAEQAKVPEFGAAGGPGVAAAVK